MRDELQNNWPLREGYAVKDVIADVAFVGAPSDPASARRWQAEIDLLQRSGKRVLVALTAGEVPEQLSARQVLVAASGAAAGLRQVAPETEVLVRRAGAMAPGIARALSDRLSRRVMIAPLDPQERATLAAALPGRWLTQADWSPLLSAEALAAGANRKIGSPWRIDLAPDAALGFDAEGLLRALVAAGVDPATVEIGPTDAANSHPAPHLLLCAERPGADDLCRALEQGTLVLVPEIGTAEPWAPQLRCAWHRLPQTIASLIDGPKPWRDAVFDLAGQSLAQWSDAAFLQRLGTSAFGVPAVAGAEPGQDQPRRRITADLAVIGDFRRPDEVNTQALAQIRAHAAAGRRILLVHVTNGKGSGSIHPGFDALIRLGMAEVLAPWDTAQVHCAQVLTPRLTIPALTVMRPAVEAARWLITETEAAAPEWDAARLHAEVFRLYGAVADWAASHTTARRLLADRLPVPVAHWPVAGPPPVTLAPEADTGELPVRPVIGMMAYDPADVGDLPASLTEQTEVELHVFLAGHRRSLTGPVPDRCKVLGLEGLDLQSFVNRLDALLVPPAAPYERMPRAAVALALARGIPVLAAPGDAPAFGAGLTHAEPSDWPDLLKAIRGGSSSRVPPVDDALFSALTGLQPKPRPVGKPAATAPRVLFVTANGVGLGHVTRLSAIARRLPPNVEPIFATMSQAASVLKDMGFYCEHLTGYTNRPADAWRASLRERLIGIIDHHRPSAIVLDSSNPYPGVLEAVACRPGTSLIWVRRGMWRETQDNSEFLTRSPYFDAIIEPQDIAEVNDPSPWRTPRVVKVPPIGLLEDHELLPKREARIALGLPPDPPPGGSVLVQLGSGTTRDLDTLLDEVLGCLRQFPGLEIVLAQWLNTTSAYDARWPGVQILSGYPIPRYYHAFDFTISAAGYNSFNDLLRFGLPTIFVANDAMNMDDQGARARFAEMAEAAFDVQENDLSPLGDCVAAILQPQVRAFLQERSRAIALPNGAQAAAHAIMETLQ